MLLYCMVDLFIPNHRLAREPHPTSIEESVRDILCKLMVASILVVYFCIRAISTIFTQNFKHLPLMNSDLLSFYK